MPIQDFNEQLLEKSLLKQTTKKTSVWIFQFSNLLEVFSIKNIYFIANELDQSIGNSKSTARTQVQRNTEQLRKNVQLQNAGRKFPSKSPLMISNNSGSQRGN